MFPNVFKTIYKRNGSLHTKYVPLTCTRFKRVPICYYAYGIMIFSLLFFTFNFFLFSLYLLLLLLFIIFFSFFLFLFFFISLILRCCPYSLSSQITICFRKIKKNIFFPHLYKLHLSMTSSFPLQVTWILLAFGFVRFLSLSPFSVFLFFPLTYIMQFFLIIFSFSLLFLLIFE